MHCVVDVMGRGPGFAADINEEVSILQVCPQLYEKQDGVVSWVCVAGMFGNNASQDGRCLSIVDIRRTGEEAQLVRVMPIAP